MTTNFLLLEQEHRLTSDLYRAELTCQPFFLAAPSSLADLNSINPIGGVRQYL